MVTFVNILIPQNLVWPMKKKKCFNDLDQKLMLVVGVVIPLLTKIGTTKDLCYIIVATMLSTSNQHASRTGI